jgi:hypothetical protein
MTPEQPGDRAFMNLMAHLGFKRALDFACGGNFPSFGSAEKGREERLLFFPGHRLSTATSFANCLDCACSQAIIPGNYPVNHRDTCASMFGNLARFSRINQGVIDNQPALPTQRARVQLQPCFDFLS